MAGKKKSSSSTRTIKVTARAEPKSPGALEHLKYDILSLVALPWRFFYVSLRKPGIPDSTHYRLLGRASRPLWVCWAAGGIGASVYWGGQPTGIRKKTGPRKVGLSIIGLISMYCSRSKTPSGMNPWEAGQAGLGRLLGHGLPLNPPGRYRAEYTGIIQHLLACSCW